jgi:hypothetical protein
MKQHALGFRQKPDERDMRFPLGELMSASVSHPVAKVWAPGRTLDQGPTSSCVGHACWQLEAGEPVVLDPIPLSPFDIYGEARKIDEWKDNDNIDAGTSVRAGLNVLKNHDLISAYYWAESAEQALEYLLKFGPLVFGTNWTQDMFNPDQHGIIRPTGNVAGGHAWFAYAGQWESKYITGLTSWGPDFGKNGSFKLSLSDVDELFRAGGCAAAVLEA